MTVIVLDDNKEIAGLLEYIIVSLGHKCHAYTSAEELMNELPRGDVLFLDYYLSSTGNNGDTIKAITEQYPDAKKYIVSGADVSDPNIMEAEQYVDAFLPKHFITSRERVSKLLGR